MKIVSACLAGINCRFDSRNCQVEEVIEMVRKGKAIPVCPEQLGGLHTPREKHEIKNGKVISESGKDDTEAFKKGALEALKIAKLINCEEAILKENSPSCGCKKIYDGSFKGNLVEGKGIFTNMLVENGIKVKNNEEI